LRHRKKLFRLQCRRGGAFPSRTRRPRGAWPMSAESVAIARAIRNTFLVLQCRILARVPGAADIISISTRLPAERPSCGGRASGPESGQRMRRGPPADFADLFTPNFS
jgi:hypothetical protein